MENLPIQIDIVDNEIRVSALIVAENTNTKYESIRDLVTKYKNELETFGLIPFTDLKSAKQINGRNKSVAMLNEQQSTLLITFLKNTKEVVAFKTNLVKAFFMMKEKLQNQLQPSESSLLPAIIEMAKVNQQIVQSNQEIVANLTNMNAGLHEMLSTIHNIKQDTSKLKRDIEKVNDDVFMNTNYVMTSIKCTFRYLSPVQIDAVRKAIDKRAEELSNGTTTNIQSVKRAIYSYINGEYNISSYYHIPQQEVLNAIEMIENINVGVNNAN